MDAAESSAYSLPHAPLQASSSFSICASSGSLTLPNQPYLISLQSTNSSKLLALDSNGLLHTVSKADLRIVDTRSFPSKRGNGNVSLTALGKMREGMVWGATDREGLARIFDDRSGSSREAALIDTPCSSPLLSLAFNNPSSSGESSAGGGAGAPLIALGHELHSVDAPLYVYDLRSPAIPLMTYDQSHSDDVTTLQFRPSYHTSDTCPFLLSGSTDGLLTVFDLSVGSDEDDAVLSATNTGASVARAGWYGPAPIGVRRGDLIPSADRESAGMDVDAAPQHYKGLGPLWSVSDMQTVSMWDAESADPLMPPLSALSSTSTSLPSRIGAGPFSPDLSWTADYIIDAISGTGTEGLQVWTGSQSGAMTLTRTGLPPPFPTHSDPSSTYDAMAHLDHVKASPWTVHLLFPSGDRGHCDIVRCLSFDDAESQGLLWSGGEDGRLVLWKLEASDGAQSRDTSLSIAPLRGYNGDTLLNKDADNQTTSAHPSFGLPSRDRISSGNKKKEKKSSRAEVNSSAPLAKTGQNVGRFNPYR